MVCICCFNFFVPGFNCHQYFYSLKQIRRLKSKLKHYNLIYVSRTFGSSENRINKSKPSKHIYSSFLCKGCNSLTIYDSCPLEFAETKQVRTNEAFLSTTKLMNDFRKKIVSKNTLNNSNNNSAKEMDLESFLHGFL